MNYEQGIICYNAAEDLWNYCQKIYQAMLYNPESVVVCFDNKNLGMDGFDSSKKTISFETLFYKIIDFFRDKLTIESVIYCGTENYICFYPDFLKLIGDAQYVSLGDSLKPRFLQIKVPHSFDSGIYFALSTYVSEELNKFSIFDVCNDTIGGIPCIKSSTEIKRIYSEPQFKQWIRVHNDLVNEMVKENTCYISGVSLISGCYSNIEDFELTAHWSGTDDEMNKLPRNVSIFQTEQRAYEENIIVERKMRVFVDEDLTIRIKSSQLEICKNYHMQIIESMNRWKQCVWVDEILYHLVDEDLEHEVKYLIDKKYVQDGVRLICILHRGDELKNKTKGGLKTEDVVYHTIDANCLGMCILVGVEDV